MNKKLIAVALAALPVAAMADVTIYGTLKGGLEHDSITNQASQNKVQDDTSIIGFKGTEDLGNGLKTIWQVENRLHVDGGTTSDTFASRQTFVGLDGGNLGTLRLGRLNNTLNDFYSVDQWQYASTVGSSGNGHTSGVNGLGIFTNSGDRVKNAIRYDSATFFGLSATAMYGFGENATNTAHADGTTGASNIWGVALNYTYGPVAAHYAYNKETNPNQPDLTTTNTLGANSNKAASKQLLEVDFNQDAWFVGAAYQWSTGYDWADDFAGDAGSTYTIHGTTYNPVSAQLKARQAALSVGYTIGAFTPKFTYAKGWDMKQGDTTLNNTGYSQYILGVDYALSKRTTAGVSFGRLSMDKNTATAQYETAGQDMKANTFAVNFAHNF